MTTRHKKPSASIADNQAGDRRIWLIADPHDQIFERADHFAGLAVNRQIGN
jgi:hypothetical protein